MCVNFENTPMACNATVMVMTHICISIFFCPSQIANCHPINPFIPSSHASHAMAYGMPYGITVYGIGVRLGDIPVPGTRIRFRYTYRVDVEAWHWHLEFPITQHYAQSMDDTLLARNKLCTVVPQLRTTFDVASTKQGFEI